MASVSLNKWYIRYLREVANGQLELPPYEMTTVATDNQTHEVIKIYYGEVFCRVEDCSKAQKNYSMTNNLRTHIKSHGDVNVWDENLGGRVSQKTVDEAIKWYKGLFSGIEPQERGNGDVPEEFSSDTAESTNANAPSLPVKKDGSVHITNMRKKVAEMGYKVPCGSCRKYNDCCKDINKCDHFVLFDCDKLHPDPS